MKDEAWGRASLPESTGREVAADTVFLLCHQPGATGDRRFSTVSGDGPVPGSSFAVAESSGASSEHKHDAVKTLSLKSPLGVLFISGKKQKTKT